MLHVKKSKLTMALLGLFGVLHFHPVMAVGNGVSFDVDESTVPAIVHTFIADSMDFTYHACSNVVNLGYDPDTQQDKIVINERGYFWASSYQDADSVVDSQLNDFQPNGYHIYGVYRFSGEQVASGTGPLGPRRGYEITSAFVSLHLDPDSDTLINLQNCNINVVNNQDDSLMGLSGNLADGEKSEKGPLANGDFELVLDNWQWNLPEPIIPTDNMTRFHLNANLTNLGGALDGFHSPEGSGNYFWKTGNPD